MSNEVINTIKERRSIRKYDDKPIEKSIIQDIIQAGKYAPSPKNTQPWQFVVITKKDKIQDLSLQIKNELKKVVKKRFIKQFTYPELKEKETLFFLYGAAMAPKDVIFFNAPALVFIITKNRLFNNEACACSAQNMMLAAKSLGIGSCWIGFASILGLNKSIKVSIGIPTDYHIAAALIFGYPKDAPSQTLMRKPMADIINWIE